MSGFGPPPVIPAELEPYNSYLIDPQWQLKFSIIWASTLGIFVLFSVPRILRAVRTGRGLYNFRNWVGIKEYHRSRDYHFLPETGEVSRPEKLWTAFRYLDNVIGPLNAFLSLTMPKVGVNIGQAILLVSYAMTVLICIIQDSQLIENANRAGFLSLAQLPVVFLLSSKNSILSLLLGPGVGYEKLNILHRWSGRVLFLTATLHGALWMNDRLKYNLPILGQDKLMTGIAAFCFLALIVLTSLRPARIFIYQTFISLHLVFGAAFYVAVCYHTPYAIPWIYPPVVIFGLDILFRMLRYRFLDAVLIPFGNQMTLVHVPHATSGWVAGQHVRLRVFFSGRVFESHPFTILSAPPDVSCISSMPSGLSLGIRVAGDWTRALNKYANEMAKTMGKSALRSGDTVDLSTEKMGTSSEAGVPVQVLVDGPYGGSSIDLGDYETVLLLSGGSGITFTLGLLDDIVGRCTIGGRKNRERTKRIEFSWCIGSFGQLDWFSSALLDIATVAAASATSSSPLYLHISVYVTCLCNPDAIPPIPNCDVIVFKPSAYQILQQLINPPTDNMSATDGFDAVPSSSKESEFNPELSPTEIIILDEEADMPLVSQKLPWMNPGGGVAVCASGPTSLMIETANAVSRVQLNMKSRELGQIGLHTEVFAL